MISLFLSVLLTPLILKSSYVTEEKACHDIEFITIINIECIIMPSKAHTSLYLYMYYIKESGIIQ